MTVHYHGTPITPRTVLEQCAGLHFCVSFANPQDVVRCHQIGQGIMLDNGAFSAWRRGIVIDWDAYYRWCEVWLKFWTTWAVIPDVIGGSEEENDRLISQWPHGTRGAPVWHMHESIERLLRLCRDWPRVCIGSSGDYFVVGSEIWHVRTIEAFNALCPGGGPPPAALHMLRGMATSEWSYPFASVDSTDVARNHHRGGSVIERARRWDSRNCPAVWNHRGTQERMFSLRPESSDTEAVNAGRNQEPCDESQK